jgi:signal transduction histidine kinase
MLTRATRRLSALVSPQAWDVLIAAFFTGLAILDLVFPHGDDGYVGGPAWLNVPLVLLMSAPLATRHRAPRATFAVMYGAAALPALFVAHTVYFWAGFLPMLLMVYTLARATDRWPARWAWAAGLVWVSLSDIHLSSSRGVGNFTFSTLLGAAAWLVGRTMRRFDLQGQALAHTLAALAAEQSTREDAAIEAERSRIAVEMHDVVAHAVSLMVVQVGATRMELERDGSKQQRLRTAEQTGRDALVELRRTLGVLRQASADDLQPLPGLTAVPALVQGFRDAGLDVVLQLSDAVGVVPVSTELAAYRILQEALTNALKHGGGRTVSASVRRVDDNLVVDVTNPLRDELAARLGGGDQAARGGLAGMRERASMFSGSLRAGRSHGRFEVHAVLPLLADVPASAMDAAVLGRAT